MESRFHCLSAFLGKSIFQYALDFLIIPLPRHAQRYTLQQLPDCCRLIFRGFLFLNKRVAVRKKQRPFNLFFRKVFLFIFPQRNLIPHKRKYHVPLRKITVNSFVNANQLYFQSSAVLKRRHACLRTAIQQVFQLQQIFLRFLFDTQGVLRHLVRQTSRSFLRIFHRAHQRQQKAADRLLVNIIGRKPADSFFHRFIFQKKISFLRQPDFRKQIVLFDWFFSQASAIPVFFIIGEKREKDKRSAERFQPSTRVSKGSANDRPIRLQDVRR